jgi:hypothetical protein
MATTVHIPQALLARVDARAKALGTSRNRVVLAALERELDQAASWPPELVQMLSEPAPAHIVSAVAELDRAIGSAKGSRKRAPKL